MKKQLRESASLSDAAYERLVAFYEAYGLRRDHELDALLAEAEAALENTADLKAFEAARRTRASMR